MIEQLTFWEQVGGVLFFILLAFALREIICFFLGTDKIGDELERIRKLLENNKPTK